MGFPFLVAIIGLFSTMNAPLTASTDIFARTEPGRVEVKELPAGILLETRVEGSYFENGNRLFRPLFRYISRHDIAMTTPVEARIEPGAMYFWVAPAEAAKVVGDEDGVRVLEQAARTVVAVGGRGAYSERNYSNAEAVLREWLAGQTDWLAEGEAYGVFWHGPFTPWFRKQYEVHQPLRRAPVVPPPSDLKDDDPGDGVVAPE